MKTPVTEAGLRQYDHLPFGDAAFAAWSNPGNNPAAHARAKEVVRNAMPLLARALDRRYEVNRFG